MPRRPHRCRSARRRRARAACSREGRATAPRLSTIGGLEPHPAEVSDPPARQTVLVVDFGAQYAQLIARRVRELNVYSEIVPHRISSAELADRRPAAVILSGGPKSVHVEGAPELDPAIYDLGVPIF